MQPSDNRGVPDAASDHRSPPPSSPTIARVVAVVVRHMVPVAMVLFFNGSASQFLLLSLFNIAFTVACIGGLGVTVSAQKKADGDARHSRPHVPSFGIVAAVVIVALLLTGAMGWWIVPLAAHQDGPLFTPSLFLSTAAIVISAVPALRFHFADDMRSSLTLRERMSRDQSNAATLLLSGVLIFMMINISLVFTMMGSVMLFIVADLRPDLLRVPFRPGGRTR